MNSDVLNSDVYLRISLADINPKIKFALLIKGRYCGEIYSNLAITKYLYSILKVEDKYKCAEDIDWGIKWGYINYSEVSKKFPKKLTDEIDKVIQRREILSRNFKKEVNIDRSISNT